MIKVVHIHDQVPNAIYIGRPSIYGNPFRIDKEVQRESVIKMYRHYFKTMLAGHFIFAEAIHKLITMAQVQDVYLACYCAPKLCHGNVIKEYIEEVLECQQKD